MTINTIHYKLPNGEERTIKQAPNQRLIEIHAACSEHGGINFDAHKQARKDLSKNAFQLYDFLSCLPNGLIWSMSSKVLYEETQLRESTYKAAFEELLEKLYLRQAPIFTTHLANTRLTYNTFHFYENSTMNPDYNN